LIEPGDGLTVFLDRDGVINRRRADHVKSWAEFEFIPGSLQALARLRRMNGRVVVITNQASVGRRLLGPEELIGIHRRMREAVFISGGRIDGIYACVHLPDEGCQCRKPGTRLFEQASAELGIELSDSFMVGDSDSDVAAARAVGARPVLISATGRNGHGPDVAVVSSLAEAVDLIAELARTPC
jgi:D-glycero-D-manno-heptose 1,7-bisphosphate phosphatase